MNAAQSKTIETLKGLVVASAAVLALAGNIPAALAQEDGTKTDADCQEQWELASAYEFCSDAAATLAAGEDGVGSDPECTVSGARCAVSTAVGDGMHTWTYPINKDRRLTRVAALNICFAKENDNGETFDYRWKITECSGNERTAATMRDDGPADGWNQSMNMGAAGERHLRPGGKPAHVAACEDEWDESTASGYCTDAGGATIDGDVGPGTCSVLANCRATYQQGSNWTTFHATFSLPTWSRVNLWDLSDLTLCIHLESEGGDNEPDTYSMLPTSGGCAGDDWPIDEITTDQLLTLIAADPA